MVFPYSGSSTFPIGNLSRCASVFWQYLLNVFCVQSSRRKPKVTVLVSNYNAVRLSKGQISVLLGPSVTKALTPPISNQTAPHSYCMCSYCLCCPSCYYLMLFKNNFPLSETQETIFMTLMFFSINISVEKVYHCSMSSYIADILSVLYRYIHQLKPKC